MPDILPLRHRFGADFTDVDIAWAIHVFRSRTQVEWCLRQLRKAYKRSRVVLISDGDDDGYDDLAERFGCSLIRGEHLYRLETAHVWVARLLQHLLAGPETYLFKIDPDTRVWRKLRSLPAFTSLFGTLETVSEGCNAEIGVPANVQGGCIGMTRDAAAAMLASRLLSKRSCGVEYRRTWARCVDMELVVANRRFSQDFLISWLAHALEIPIVESAEIRSRWRRVVDNPSKRYAITHPHKLGRARR